MALRSDYITSVTAEHKETGIRTAISTKDINHPDTKNYHYYCTDCLQRGHKVAMQFVRGSKQSYNFETFNRATERPFLNDAGEPRTKEKILKHPDHWVRKAGAEKHRCDNDVRYSKLRSTALQLNARPIPDSNHKFVFPIGLPVHGIYAHQTGDHDIRSRVRPLGMGMQGIVEAKNFIRLLKVFKDDPGLQHLQVFDDGMRRRNFDETMFEDRRALHTYLREQGAIGRDRAIVCAYAFNPNNSRQALQDVSDGFVDRSFKKMSEMEKEQLFVRGANAQSAEILHHLATRNGFYQKAPIMVIGESWIDAIHPSHVEMEIYSPFQIDAWDDEDKFTPPFDPKAGHSPALGL